MSSISLIFIISLSLDVRSQMSFSVDRVDDGAFIPDWKDKKVGYRFGEDYFVTTPYGISLADGVGGSSFASLHLSKHLTTSFGYWILFCLHDTNKTNLCKDFENRESFSVIRNLMNITVNKELDIINNIVNREGKRIQDKALLNSFNDFSFDQASTFVSAYFSPNTQKNPHLNVFQKGDSLALILRFDAYSMNWKPYAYTSNNHKKINQPYQYIVDYKMPKDHYKDDDDIRFFSIEPYSRDVVILGSDGLFDNVPVSIITLAFNAMIKKLSKEIGIKEESKFSPRLYLRSYVEAYKRIIGKLTPSDFGDNPQQPEPTYTADDFDENCEEKDKAKKLAILKAKLKDNKLTKLKAKKIDEGLEKSVGLNLISAQRAPIDINENREKPKNENSKQEDEKQKFQIPKDDSNKIEEGELIEVEQVIEQYISPELEFVKPKVLNHESASLDTNKNNINSKTINLEGNVNESQTTKPLVDKTVPGGSILKCKTKDLFFHRETATDFRDWDTFKGLDSCFEEILDQLFKFEVDDYDRFHMYYKPRVVAEAIAEFAKELTLDPSSFSSPFWIRTVKDEKQTHLEALNEKRRKIDKDEPLTPEESALGLFKIEDIPFRTKPNDISVIAASMSFKDIHRPRNPKLPRLPVAELRKAETLLIKRLDLLDKRNQSNLEEDLIYFIESNFK